MKGCYVYFCDKELEQYFRSRIKETAPTPEIEKPVIVLPRIEPEVNDDVKYIDYLPVYSIKAACGAFGDYQSVDAAGWIKAEGFGRLGRNMFVVKATGH